MVVETGVLPVLPAFRHIAEKGLLSSKVRYAYEACFDPEEIDRLLAITRPAKRLPRCWTSRYRS